MWEVRYKKSVTKDVKKISPVIRRILRRAIENKLMSDPLRYGVPLRRTLKGFMKLRVGDWRIIFTIGERRKVVTIFKVGHRREVYRQTSFRNENVSR